jgi:TonB family protein
VRCVSCQLDGVTRTRCCECCGSELSEYQIASAAGAKTRIVQTSRTVDEAEPVEATDNQTADESTDMANCETCGAPSEDGGLCRSCQQSFDAWLGGGAAPTAINPEAPTVLNVAAPTVLGGVEAPTVIGIEAPTVIGVEAPTVLDRAAPAYPQAETPTIIQAEAPTVLLTKAPTLVPEEAPTVLHKIGLVPPAESAPAKPAPSDSTTSAETLLIPAAPTPSVPASAVAPAADPLPPTLVGVAPMDTQADATIIGTIRPAIVRPETPATEPDKAEGTPPRTIEPTPATVPTAVPAPAQAPATHTAPAAPEAAKTEAPKPKAAPAQATAPTPSVPRPAPTQRSAAVKGPTAAPPPARARKGSTAMVVLTAVVAAIGAGAYVFRVNHRPAVTQEPPAAVVENKVEVPAPKEAPARTAKPEPTPAPPAPPQSSRTAARTPAPKAASPASQQPVEEPAPLPSRPAAPLPAPEPAAPVADVAAAPASPAAPLTPFYETTDVNEPPQVTTRVEPQLPDELRGRSPNEVVIVRVLVSESGHPFRVSVLRKSKAGPSLDNAVIAAVSRWAFSPAKRRGEAVSCWLNMGVPIGRAN